MVNSRSLGAVEIVADIALLETVATSANNMMDAQCMAQGEGYGKARTPRIVCPLSPAPCPSTSRQVAGAGAPHVRANCGRRYDFLNHLPRWGSITIGACARSARGPTGDLPITRRRTGTGDLALAFDRAAGRLLPIVARRLLPRIDRHRPPKSGQAGAGRSHYVLEADAQSLPAAERHVPNCFGRFRSPQRRRYRPRPGRDGPRRRPGCRIAVLEFSTPERSRSRRFTVGTSATCLPRIGQWSPQFVGRPTNTARKRRPIPARRGAGRAHARGGTFDVRCYPLTLGVATLYVGKKGESRMTNDE